MKFVYDTPAAARTNKAPVIAALGVVMMGIFLVDTLTDYAVAIAVFYSAVILVATNLLTSRAVILLTGASILLTLISFVLTRFGSFEVGVINTSISIVAISITAYLGMRIAAAEAIAREARLGLVRIARVTSIAQLTASIAHEVNQPLAAIVTSGDACTRWLSQDPPNLDKARRALARIVADANRASEVIVRVRRLAKGESPDATVFNLNDAIEEVVSLSLTEIDRHDIVLRRYLQEALPAVRADRIQIQQVVGNLLLNAIEAVTASPRREREIEIEIISSGEDSRAVVVAVTDNGIGFTPGTSDRLFDAFWTTKDGGMGLGLTLSRSIIEANGGQISTATNPAGGAIVRFSLPLAEGDGK